MANVPGLRSPYVKVGRLVYFGRMLDKIRLHAAGRLPAADYASNLGKGFDSRCCNFLRVNYAELTARVPAGGTDEECEVWNGFMMKRGWRDASAEILAKRIKESALEAAPVMTMFDYLDFDEGRDPVSLRAWEK